jgi:hypothetical protein
MPADINIGNNYELDENSNGNLIIKDSTGSVILKHTDGGNFSLGAALELGDLLDGATGDTVYDGSTETVGDGNQNGNFNSLNTESATISGRPASVGLSEGDSTTLHRANLTTVADSSYNTIFDVSSAVDVLFGAVYGHGVTGFRVTWGSGSTDTFGTEGDTYGRDQAGDFSGSLVVPFFRQITELEFYATAAADIGYVVVTT